MTGTVVNSIFGLGFYILLGRGLGAGGFGYFSYLLGLGLLAAEVADLGFNSALVRFGAGEKFPAIFSLVFLVRLVSAMVITAVFFFPSWFFDRLLIYSAMVAIVGVFSYLTIQGMIARQEYFGQVVASIAGNLVRLSLVLGLFLAGLLTPVSALVVFCLGGGVTFLTGLSVLLRSYGLGIVADISRIKEVWHEAVAYVPGVAFSFGLSSLAAKIDMPIVFALAGPVATGIYSSAQKLTSVFQQIAAAIEGVFAPKFANTGDYRRHFQEYLFVVFLLIVGVLILVPLAPILVPMFFGSGYIGAVVVFQVLLVATALFFASGPFAAAVLYKHGRSKYHLAVSAVSFVVSLSAYFVLVPRFGAVGAAGVFVVNALITLLGFVVVWKRLE